jgi:hypothetical protein
MKPITTNLIVDINKQLPAFPPCELTQPNCQEILDQIQEHLAFLQSSVSPIRHEVPALLVALEDLSDTKT